MKRPYLTQNEELVICDQCGCKTDIYMKSGSLFFCSTHCKELADSEIFDSKDADKYDSVRDLEMEDSFDEELDSMNPDRF